MIELQRLYICNPNIYSYTINARGDPRLDDLSSCSAKFLPSRAGVFRFFDSTTNQLRWSVYTPRMPAVATTGGICGSLCWTCGSERARKAEIEVLCHPRTDHFSRSLKGSRLYVREVTINDARGQETPINHGTMERALSIKCVWERPGGRVLGCPFCTDVILPRFAPPTKGRAYAIWQGYILLPKENCTLRP